MRSSESPHVIRDVPRQGFPRSKLVSVGAAITIPASSRHARPAAHPAHRRHMNSDQFLPFLDAWRGVLWPDFVEHDGCVFRGPLKDWDDQTYRNWMIQTDGDRRRVEAVMNHLHIADVLEAVVPSPSREVVLAFGRLMRDLWTQKLSRDFPDRTFIVAFPEEHQDEVIDHEITFSQAASPDSE